MNKPAIQKALKIAERFYSERVDEQLLDENENDNSCSKEINLDQLSLLIEALRERESIGDYQSNLTLKLFNELAEIVGLRGYNIQLKGNIDQPLIFYK